MDGTVLIADDDRTIRTVLTQALSRAGCKVHATSSLTTLMRWVGEGMGDAVITDVMMPDGNGLEMLPRIAEDRPGLPVIVISAQNTIMTAIRAEQADAFDYLPKPFDLPDLLKRTARALEGRAQRSSTAEPAPDALPLVGRSAVMQGLYRVIARVMNADLPVLITGESGVGKSLIARVLHEYSDRRAEPFVAYSSDAGLLAEAARGTILIEDIGALAADQQARIVQMMDQAGVDGPRFVATTQTDLTPALDSGALRKDLYYRLSGAVLNVPSLRERPDDIPLLSAHFLDQLTQGTPGRDLSEEALVKLRNYPWPGNVRQLENILQRLVLTGQGPEISSAEVMQVLSGPVVAGLSMSDAPAEDKLGASVHRHLRRYFDLHEGMLPPAGLYARIIREVELPLIEVALDATGGNQIKCADLLGINRNTLRKKITDLDIEVTRRRKMM